MGLTANYTLQKKRSETLKTGKKKKTIQKWMHRQKKNTKIMSIEPQ